MTHLRTILFIFTVILTTQCSAMEKLPAIPEQPIEKNSSLLFIPCPHCKVQVPFTPTHGEIICPECKEKVGKVIAISMPTEDDPPAGEIASTQATVQPQNTNSQLSKKICGFLILGSGIALMITGLIFVPQ